MSRAQKYRLAYKEVVYMNAPFRRARSVEARVLLRRGLPLSFRAWRQNVPAVKAQILSGAIQSPASRFRLAAISLFCLQGLIWISLPLIFDGSIRRDVAEGVVDGPSWQLSYQRWLRLFGQFFRFDKWSSCRV
jgi:hypothetical protein